MESGCKRYRTVQSRSIRSKLKFQVPEVASVMQSCGKNLPMHALTVLQHSTARRALARREAKAPHGCGIALSYTAPIASC
jgi:hypothetical protein